MCVVFVILRLHISIISFNPNFIHLQNRYYLLNNKCNWCVFILEICHRMCVLCFICISLEFSCSLSLSLFDTIDLKWIWSIHRNDVVWIAVVEVWITVEFKHSSPLNFRMRCSCPFDNLIENIFYIACSIDWAFWNKLVNVWFNGHSFANFQWPLF